MFFVTAVSYTHLLETSIEGAKGVLINVTGSMDIGLEEVEQAASLVQAAVHPDEMCIRDSLHPHPAASGLRRPLGGGCPGGGHHRPAPL